MKQRRSELRREVKCVPVLIRFISPTMPGIVNGVLVNVSRSGVCVFSGTRFPRDSVIQIRFSGVVLLVETMNCIKAADNVWRTGTRVHTVISWGGNEPGGRGDSMGSDGFNTPISAICASHAASITGFCDPCCLRSFFRQGRKEGEHECLRASQLGLAAPPGTV